MHFFRGPLAWRNLTQPRGHVATNPPHSSFPWKIPNTRRALAERISVPLARCERSNMHVQLPTGRPGAGERSLGGSN